MCTLVLTDINNDSSFVGSFAGSLRHWQTGLYPGLSGADSLIVGGCTTQLEFDNATSIATNGRSPISEGLQGVSGKGKCQPDNRNGCEKYNDSDVHELLLGFDKKGIGLYMKHCKVLI